MSERSTQFVRTKLSWGNNIKMDYKWFACKVDWILAAQENVQLLALANMITNFQVKKRDGHFLASWTIIYFSV
jgi:hypothetical protein